MKRVLKDQKGFSLIELIIVMAIIVIAGTTMFIGMSMVSGKPAQKMAKSVENALKRLKTTTMAKKSATMELKLESDGWMLYETVEGDTYPTAKIGDADVKVTYILEGASEVESTDLTFEFNRSDGSLKSFNGAPPTKTVELCFERAGKVARLKIIRFTGKMNVTLD